jgi:hypothetical protein
VTPSVTWENTLHASKDDWNQLQDYVHIFESISKSFIENLDHEKVGKLDVQLPQANLLPSGMPLEQAIGHLKDSIIP